MINRYPILNVSVDAVNMSQALEKIVEFIEKSEKLHTVFAVNPEKTFSVPENPLLHDMFMNADLLIPDGIGIVLAARLLHGAKLSRVPGCEFMQNTCTMAAQKGYKIFIYGAAEDVNRKAADELIKRNKGLQIIGRQNGYLAEEDMDSLIERINDSRAEILFIALGSPKQELWISTYRNRLKHVKVCQGIGGTLDVIAGNVKRAPAFYCSIGLEWLYRLLSEPKRYKRQKLLPLFVFRIISKKLSLMVYGK